LHLVVADRKTISDIFLAKLRVFGSSLEEIRIRIAQLADRLLRHVFRHFSDKGIFGSFDGIELLAQRHFVDEWPFLLWQMFYRIILPLPFDQSPVIRQTRNAAALRKIDALSDVWH